MKLSFALIRHNPVDSEAEYNLELIEEEERKRKQKAELRTILKVDTVYKDENRAGVRGRIRDWIFPHMGWFYPISAVWYAGIPA